MAGRIVLFGATGYTGRLTAESMVRRGLRPLLAARSESKLRELAGELGGLDIAVADVSDPPTVTRLVERGDVLVTTVGPFARFGHPAAAAAVTKGAHYLDSTGEPPFIREVFERYGPVARHSGSGMLAAFGYDWVPGNLAGALAAQGGGEHTVRVDAGYFTTGQVSAAAASGGTQASLAGVIGSPGFAFRDGRIRTERVAARCRKFEVGGRERSAVSVPTSEHFGLPAVAPQLREVRSYLGWFGPASRPFQGMSLLMDGASRIPGVTRLWEAAASRLVKGSSGGPGPEERARSGSHVVAIAYDANGRELARVDLVGANGYDFTADVLAWGAERAASGGLQATGALGPVEGFGLEELRAGCAEAGLTVAGEDRPAARPAPAGKAGTPA